MNYILQYENHWRATSFAHAITLVGGNPDELRKREKEFLKGVGLQPYHKLLDIGCGCLRGTIDLVDYLDNGNFYGIDISETMLKYAAEQLKKNNTNNTPNLKKNTDFNIEVLFPGIKFDYVFAASVFTHIYPEDVKDCLMNVVKVMNEDFYATAFLLDEKHSSTNNGDVGKISYKLSWLKSAALEYNLKTELSNRNLHGGANEYPSIHHQSILKFSK